MTINATDAAIRALAAEKRLPQVHLERWLAMDADSSSALISIAHTLKLRTGQLATAIELLDEIAVREKTSAARVLGGPRARAIVDGGGSAPERARAMLEHLRLIRFPELVRTRAALDADIKALNLPGGAQVVLPSELASDEVTVTLRFRNAGEFERMLARLNDAKLGISAILDKLGGKE